MRLQSRLKLRQLKLRHQANNRKLSGHQNTMRLHGVFCYRISLINFRPKTAWRDEYGNFITDARFTDLYSFVTLLSLFLS